MSKLKNKYFRSIFLKYVSAFMLINLVCLLLLSVITTSLISSYGNENQLNYLSDAAQSLETYLSDDYVKTIPKYLYYYTNDQIQDCYITYEDGYSENEQFTFSKYLSVSEKDIRSVITLLSDSIKEMFVFVVDRTGEIYVSGGAESLLLETELTFNSDGKYVVNSDIMNKLRVEGIITDTTDLGGLLNRKNIVSALPITDSRSRSVGAVFVCTKDSGVDSLLDAMQKTIIMSCLWIMLASLIATYFISERLVAPIKDMRRAARLFSEGKFDARVTVVGNDEIAELAVTFNEMASNMQELEDMRRSFLANVSHDLRTPMTTISGFIDSILEGAIPPEKYDYYLGVIGSEIKRLSRLVMTLLDITKMQAGERKFIMAPFDIAEMARLILISFEQKIDTKHLDVEFECDKDSMFVNADRDAIYQVLYNICDNGIKFSKEGGKYSITVTEKDSKTTISVFNEGVGIPKEEQKYIFDRFYKSDKSRGLDKTGVGLGMYISRTIIEAHNEKIWLESEPGEYCRFSFTLPSCAEQPKSVSDSKENTL